MLFGGLFGVDCGRETECVIDGREVAVDAGGRGFDEELKKKLLILDDEEEFDVVDVLSVVVGRVCVCEMVEDRPRTTGVLGTAVNELAG